MYQHKCEAAKSAEYPKGISITARVLANLKPVDGDRYFWVDDPHGDLFPDDTKVDELYCLDCDEVVEYLSEVLAEEHTGKELWLVERRLKEGYYSTIQWVD
jgi:hypothetical protein